MRLKGLRRSSNIEDRRGRRTGMTGGARGRVGGLGIVGVVVVLAVGYFTGIDVSPLLQGTSAPPATQVTQAALPADEQQAGEFASQVLATTEDVWAHVFQTQLNANYTPPILVLFSQVTSSPCGNASGATGPFYCPVDQKAYLDTAFFATLARQMGAEGDFAAAYVIAHEVGHHVQNELGILGKAQELQRQFSAPDANAVSVRVELQADCLAGIWANAVDGLLEHGDIEEALNAAEKIGDDYLMARAGRTANPHNYTHGTSEQRMRWFARGQQSGQIADCDTFSADRL